MARTARILGGVCFNLTFESEDDLAAIAAGMAPGGELAEDLAADLAEVTAQN